MDMNEDILKLFVEAGYVEVAGYNAAGDPIYKLTKLFYDEQKELAQWMKEQDSDIMNSLWFKGFIDLMMDSEGKYHIYLNERSDTWVRSDDLTEDEKSMMYLIYSTGAYSNEES
jgi:hypothetical protein